MNAANTNAAKHLGSNLPLLTELGGCFGLVFYKHGAPDGAFPRSYSIKSSEKPCQST
jgi:hypothetical protein